MKRHHYLSQEEADAIEDLCKNNKSLRFLRVIKSLALKVETTITPKMFSLSGEELLYFVVFCIDDLRERTISKVNENNNDLEDYAETLWDYWVSHFNNNRDYPDSDIKDASTLIVSTLENCLNIVKMWQDIRNKLILSGRRSNGEHREKVENVICEIMYSDNHITDLRNWLERYLEGDIWLSDIITDKIKSLRSNNNMQGLGFDEKLISELKAYFWNEEADTTDFIQNIYGKKDIEVIKYIADLAQMNKIVKWDKKKLYRILHGNGLYNANDRNFSQQLKKLGW